MGLDTCWQKRKNNKPAFWRPGWGSGLAAPLPPLFRRLVFVSPKGLLGPHEIAHREPQGCPWSPRVPNRHRKTLWAKAPPITACGNGLGLRFTQPCVSCLLLSRVLPRCSVHPSAKVNVKNKHHIAHNFVWWNGSSCQVFALVFFCAHSLGTSTAKGEGLKHENTLRNIFWGGTAHPTKGISFFRTARSSLGSVMHRTPVLNRPKTQSSFRNSAKNEPAT